MRKENRFKDINSIKELKYYSKSIRNSFIKIQERIKEEKIFYKDSSDILEYLDLKIDYLWFLYSTVNNDFCIRYAQLSDKERE